MWSYKEYKIFSVNFRCIITSNLLIIFLKTVRFLSFKYLASHSGAYGQPKKSKVCFLFEPFGNDQHKSFCN